jgi:Ca2+-binding RTX toxin-like protein
VDGLGGADNIHGLRGDDCLRGNDGNDVINGHEGNDKIQGDGGQDNLHGNAGDDVIHGGDGHDTIEAGEGQDWAEGGAGHDAMQGEGGNDTMFGGNGRDTVEGNGGDDIVLGGGDNDRVAGHDGNDLVAGGADDGRVRVNGAGAITRFDIGDTISGDGGADRFVWQKGDGVDWLLDFRPSEGDTLTIYGYGGFQAVDRVDGQTVLVMDTNSAIVLNDFYPLNGVGGPFPGITFVPGSATAPDLPVERGPIHGGMGADSLAGTNRADRLDGLHGDDTLSGLAGADTVEGSFGDDLLIGGAGPDLLDGGADLDTASYADAPAGVTASLGQPGGNAGHANGDVYVSVENLVGSAFDDALSGDGAANRIEGGAGADSIGGGAGQDSLVGGVGQDLLTGGAGADRFVFAAFADSAAAAPDTMADFAWVQNDRIDLSAIDADAVAAGDQAFVFVGGGAFAGGGQGSVRFAHAGADTLVEVDGGDGGAAEMVIRLVGLHQPVASDFVL